MNIGSLYKIKECFWLLFPTKETVSVPTSETTLALGGDLPYNAATSVSPAAAASYWSKRFNCEVTYFSPDSIVVFLEEDGKLKKVLTSDGKIGWTWFDESYNDCFEEVKTEE